MKYQDLEERLSQYLNTEESCRSCLGVLSSQSEIQIVVDGSHSLCVHPQPGTQVGKIEVASQACQSPDFIFRASSEAIEIMIAEKDLSPGELGLKLAKQYFAQQIEFEMHGHFLHILRKGYLKIVAVGGTEFLQGLAQYNLGSLRNIMQFLRHLASANK